jgi:beta-lactamase class A
VKAANGYNTFMTLVMDGVRGGGVLRARPHKKRPAVVATPAGRIPTATELRLEVGMDGLRRPQSSAEAPAAVSQDVTPAPAVETERVAAVTEPVIPEMQPDLLLAAESNRKAQRTNWARPVMAIGFALTTLVVSATAVRLLSTRNSTARAETAVVHATISPGTKRALRNGLQPLLDTFVANDGSSFGIVVKDLKTGETASVNPGQGMESASLYKLFVAQRVFQQIDLGQLKYSQDAGAGDGETIGQCLTVMINISDNTCGRALGTILDWGAQDQARHAEGYTNTELGSPQQTTPNDVAKLLERLYRGTLLSPDSTNRFLALLKDQKVNNRLPTGLPAGTVIAHKTGDLDGFSHDVGIVYGADTDYLVVIMSGPWGAPGNAPGAFTDLSQRLWNYFEQ